MGIAVIDIVFIVIILIFAVHCAVKGFVSEIMSLAAVIMGILSAIFFFREGAAFIRDRFMPDVETIPNILSFIVIFLAVFCVVKIIGLMLKSIIEGIRLGGLNHVLGFIFGAAEGVVVVCLLLFVINVLPFENFDRILNGSFFAELLLPFIRGKQKEIADMIAVMINGFLPSVGVAGV